MLTILPCLAWLAAMTSAALLVALWKLDDLRGATFAAVVGCFLLAAYCQFLGGSALLVRLGHVLQTVLAVYLLMRWKTSS